MKKNSRYGKSVRFPQAHHLREMLGLNKGKLPANQTMWHFEYGGLKFRLLPASNMIQRRSRPHRLMVECNVCKEWMSAGRFNQHQYIHPRAELSELSKNWLAGGR